MKNAQYSVSLPSKTRSSKDKDLIRSEKNLSPSSILAIVLIQPWSNVFFPALIGSVIGVDLKRLSFEQ